MLARIRRPTEEKDRGFTLIELLVVMIIIGILAAVAIPVYLTQKRKAVDSAIKSDLVAVAQQIETDAADSQTYPNGAWVAAGTGGVVSASDSTVATPAVAASVRITKGDAIHYKKITGGFCLSGEAANSTATGAPWWAYRSTGGGLLDGLRTSAEDAGC